MKKRKLTPAKTIALCFFAVILVGTLLLMLPFASRKPGSIGFVDSLFTATSATCVTGLAIADTYTAWTSFGQLVILALIQIGGLGFLTIIASFFMLLGKKLGLFDRRVLMQSAGDTTLGGIRVLLRRIVPISLLVELAGAAVLATQFVPDFGVRRGLYASAFHAISAFCNAGFDILGMRTPDSSLLAYNANPLVILTISALIILGGLGFFVWTDVLQTRMRWRKLQVHSKLVLTMTAALLLGAWVLLLGFEWNHAFSGMPVGQKILNAFFCAVSPRTAGFYSVNMATLSDSGTLTTMVLMFIGGGSGSTAGGIKITTFAVLLLTTISAARGRMRVHACRHAVSRETLRQATSILFIYLGMTLAAVLAISAIEPFGLKAVAFEAVSAIGTVGLTLGITPLLTAAGKLILTVLMYAGRIGGMTFVLMFTERRSEPPVDRPEAKIMIG
ncbi:MAG: TrkH family potassium uptake protein [Oscillospiraceae bacterium]|nr:TrkH family potassium uptake protein [Oscillospiraceae bacterium]